MNKKTNSKSEQVDVDADGNHGDNGDEVDPMEDNCCFICILCCNCNQVCWVVWFTLLSVTLLTLIGAYIGVRVRDNNLKKDQLESNSGASNSYPQGTGTYQPIDNTPPPPPPEPSMPEEYTVARQADIQA
jgi:hypothetical protein